MAERSEKRAERRGKRAKGRQLDSLHIYGVRGQVEKVLKIRKVHPHRITPYLRCPVTTSKSAEKYSGARLPKVCKAEVASKRLAKQIRLIFTVSRDHVVEGRKV